MNKWWIVAFVLAVLYIIGTVFAVFIFNNNSASFSDRIVVVPIEGEISAFTDNGFFGRGGVSSNELVKTIKELDEDNSVKGIIFEINSPGGAVVASQEISDAISRMNKTNYAVIRDVGASGAYWIASATDKIIASPMSITGSIGVYSSYLEFSDLFNKYGVNYQRLVSGKYKDIGIPYRDLTDEEEKLLQSKLNIVHEFFIKEIAKNRKMDVQKIKDVATGEFFLGNEAKDIGLIDEFGDRETAVNLLKEQLNLTDIDVVEHRQKISFLDKVLGSVAYQFGRGFGSVIVDAKLNNGIEIRV